jgi:hypothetical protein
MNTLGQCSRSRWPRNLRRGHRAARLLVLRVQIPPGPLLSVYCECCVLSDFSVTGPSHIQRGPTACVCVCVCDRGTSQARPRPTRTRAIGEGE